MVGLSLGWWLLAAAVLVALLALVLMGGSMVEHPGVALVLGLLGFLLVVLSKTWASGLRLGLRLPGLHVIYRNPVIGEDIDVRQPTWKCRMCGQRGNCGQASG